MKTLYLIFFLEEEKLRYCHTIGLFNSLFWQRMLLEEQSFRKCQGLGKILGHDFRGFATI